MNKQRGGTILGLMIGVVLGLAAALAVAVFVTKTPSPFNNKMQTHGADADATESKKNKDWDPNAVLAGKNPAKPTPPALPGAAPTNPVGTPDTAVVAPAVAPPKATANTAPAMPPEKSEKATKAAASPVVAGALSASVATDAAATAAAVKPSPKPTTPADPLGDLMKSKAETKPASAGAEPFMYFVQAGAFRTPEDAEAQRARLSLQGIDAKVTEREQAGRTVYRVRSGPFNKEDDADRMKDKISATGADAALVRVQR
jgi:cell division protein FtsN